MSEQSESERQQVLDRLRRERPDDTWFICGYPGKAPTGYERVYSTNRLRYVDVPERAIRSTHQIPADGQEPGIALILEGDADFSVKRTTLSDLLKGDILDRLGDIASLFICKIYATKTPKHVAGAWLDTEAPEVDWKPRSAPPSSAR